MKHYIRQRCLSAIARILEGAAENGVLCRLVNCSGHDCARLLFPRLLAMNFDQPEAQLSFGMQNRQSCSKCRWRKGRSAFRRGTVQKGTTIKRLYQIANGSGSSRFQQMARTKLHHWGFNSARPSALHSACNHLLVRIPGLDEVYPCIDFRDIMHGMKIFLHRVCVLDTLAVIPFSAASKRTLFERLRMVLQRQKFRDGNGNPYRPVTRIFTDTNMTARDRVHLLFLLPHLLGHTGDILHPRLRDPMLSAIAHAQLLIIACSGQRAYNRNELSVIFDQGWLVLFGSLERVHAELYSIRVEEARNTNGDLPAAFQRTARYVTVLGANTRVAIVIMPNNARTCINTTQVLSHFKKQVLVFIITSTCCCRDPDCTDSEDTGSDEDVGGLGKFSHGNYGLVHQHWMQQLIIAGSFSVHNTEAPEAQHKLCMKLASTRVRHLHESETKSSMLKFLCYHDLFNDMLAEMCGPAIIRRVNYPCGVRLELPIDMCATRLLQSGYQQQFLHPEALITRYELLDLLCSRFGIPRNRRSYSLIGCLQWTFGQKMMRQDGKVFWATDSRYPFGVTKKRRDILRIHGTERVNDCLNSLCCKAILFITISGLKDAPGLHNVVGDEIELVLGRWFAPHPSTRNCRDAEQRPLCPGPFNINHCLWTYAKASSQRKSLFNTDGTRSRTFNSQRNLFGRTVDEQTSRAELDRYSYFGLIDVNSITKVVHMTPQFVNDSVFHDYTSWLETVTVV